ncbi:tetratricopeptide repeat protein, partial [Mariprofundus ferrooxydans]|uniref:tetratricopeptide repeat protein n=1 Tax=Mariprofundus ferrooxydans TaxID=314344 RepID=UPI001430AD04
MYSLISFATQWGSKHGGINSFNTDFLSAFGIAYQLGAQVVCIVSSATKDEVEEARNANVTLIPLPFTPQSKHLTADHAKAGIEALKKHSVNFEPENTIWLGHDLISGGAANEAAKIAGGQSALIHHMSYRQYESFAEDSNAADKKNQEQRLLFNRANLAMAIGPLLRDALTDMLSSPKDVHMLVPGLAEIEASPAPKTFTAFLCGRLSDDAARIKQGYLGVAAVSDAYRTACDNNMPDGLCKRPLLMLRGVDDESKSNSSLSEEMSPEAKLKKFAARYADREINLQALPYTHDRNEIYGNISKASVALMPSWHEGFGLVAWEAIAAGVPLVIGKESGVCRLLDEEIPGAGLGCVYPIDVKGLDKHPFFHEDDLKAISMAITSIAYKPEKARQQAGLLRGLLSSWTWPACAEQAANAFKWQLQKGSIPSKTKVHIKQPMDAAISTSIASISDSPLQLPSKQWQTGGVFADSQLLRAEEAVVPFDPARNPELDELNTWLDDVKHPLAVRLITGSGGLGKTRLALELCQQREELRWHAGLLNGDLEAKDMASSWQELKKLNKPLLIVIDYAETRQTILLSLIRAMLQSPCEHLVRLLMLARDGGEWWDNLPSKDRECEKLLSGYATSGPFLLPELHAEIQDREHAYQLALAAFSQAFCVPAPDLLPDLTGDHYGRPLYLQMSALLALHGERPTTPHGLTSALLNHERRYWQGLFDEASMAEPARHSELLLALSTLAGGFATPKAAQAYWKMANGNVISAEQFHQLFYALMPLYPGAQGLQEVRPDILGEALVAKALQRPAADDLLDSMLGKDSTQLVRRNALTVIARLSDHYQELNETLTEALVRHFAYSCQEIVTVASETPSLLSELAEKAFARLPPNTKSQVSGILESRVHEESVQLGGLYCLVNKHLVSKFSKKLQRKNFNINLLEAHAKALGNYANSLFRIGCNNEALSLAKEVMNEFGKLKKINSNRFEPYFASSLNNYSNFLSDVGQNEDALDYAKRSLEIRQRLAQKNPDRFDSYLATALNNYSNRLSDAGQNEDALDYAKRSLEIHQRLAQKNPDRFDSDLATALNNYSNRLSDAGQNEDALDYAKRSLEIRQRLAQKNPDR